MNQKGVVIRFLSIFVIVVLIGTGIYIVQVRQTPPPHSNSSPTTALTTPTTKPNLSIEPASTNTNNQALPEGKEISIEGTYIKNTTDKESDPNTVDGASYQVMDTKVYGQIKIIIGGFRMNCLAREIYQPTKGEAIEVYGKVVSNSSSRFFNGHVLSVCLSDQYHITKKR